MNSPIGSSFCCCLLCKKGCRFAPSGLACSSVVLRHHYSDGVQPSANSRTVHPPQQPSETFVRSTRPSIWPKKIQTHSHIAQFLFENLLFAQNGVFAFSKPVGVSCFGMSNASPLRRSIRNVESNDFEEDGSRESFLSVQSVLPLVAVKLKEFDELQVTKAIPRYVSGPVLVTNSVKSLRLVQGALTRIYSTKKEDEGVFRAIALCVGRMPRFSAGPVECRAKIIIVKDIGMCDVIHDDEYRSMSRKELRRPGAVVSDWFHYRVLGESAGCSLVELSFNTFLRHVPRLFLMSQGAPILGDAIYQCRLARILGQTVPVLPHNASVKNQYVPSELLKELKISLREYHTLPIFLHVHGIRLKKLFGKKSEDVFIHDPLPSHFDAVLRLLGLRDCIDEK